MIFDENSFLVRLYVKKINESNGTMTTEDVPQLYNLREVVEKLINGI